MSRLLTELPALEVALRRKSFVIERFPARRSSGTGARVALIQGGRRPTVRDATEYLPDEGRDTGSSARTGRHGWGHERPRLDSVVNFGDSYADSASV